MSTQVFYFSGTGNSLHIAAELARMLPRADAVPIVGALRSGGLQTTADTVGIVFPIYASTIPETVKEFLLRADFSSASYLFAVTSRECSAKVFRAVDRLLSRQGKRLNGRFMIHAPQNYLPVFEMPTKKEVADFEAGLPGRLATIEEAVQAGRSNEIKDSPLVFIIAHIVYPLISAIFRATHSFGIPKSFYADDNCNGCGLCQKVCLSERIRMDAGKPRWDEDVSCMVCFACIHYCPRRAIQLRGRKTAVRGRYHYPGISAVDIAGQKGEPAKEAGGEL